jgi:hypothetical protein
MAFVHFCLCSCSSYSPITYGSWKGWRWALRQRYYFDFETDDTFLKHGSLSVCSTGGARSGFTCTSFGPTCFIRVLTRSKRILQNACLYPLLRKKPAERYGGASIHWIACSLSLPCGLPLPDARLMRSATNRATPVRENRCVENAPRAPSDPALPIDDTRRVSIDNIYQRH